MITRCTDFDAHVGLCEQELWIYVRESRAHTQSKGKIGIHGKLYELTGQAAIHVPKPFEFIGKATIHPKPNDFIRKAVIHGPKPYEFIGQIAIRGSPKIPVNSQGKWPSMAPNLMNS